MNVVILFSNFFSFQEEACVKSFVICLIFPKWMFFIFLNILPRSFYDSRHENGISNVELKLIFPRLVKASYIWDFI